jgi:DNA modification methylase
MTPKRRALSVLRKTELLEVGKIFELEVSQRMTVDELVDVVAGSKRATLDEILGTLSRDTLKAICGELGLATDGREKRLLVDRVIEATGGERKAALETGSEAAPAADGADSPPGSKPGKGKTPPPAKQQAWLNFPTLGSTPQPEAPSATATTMRSLASDDWTLTLEVERRKPRLAWQGMWRKEVAVPVPTQVVEIVHPGRAIRRDDELIAEARLQTSRDATLVPPNRLIWTNDNLVALTTLLEERDPATRDYRYRGKIDLVYIDPPFMVNSDFRADNSVDIDLDESVGVVAKKEPSLVEMLAYKDTWRQGLDTFLSMLRRRLELLRDLLSDTGVIYVHMDWHAVHYVKVLLDEIFGYENFVNEIAWQRQTSHNDLSQGAKHLGRVHDTILVYARSADSYSSPIFSPYDGSYVRSHYSQVDASGRRFQYGDLTGPGGAAKGNPHYELMGHLKYWRFKEERMLKMVEEGRVVQPTPGAVPRHKRFLDEMPGIPIQDVWSDVNPINSQALEALGYPTQKPIALLERIIALSCPPAGIVLDCFAGSGSTAEAAERLGRRWICIDNGKYAVHLARKRLIQLHGQPRPPEIARSYVACEHCGNVERKERKAKEKLAPFQVQAFTVENMGVYQRAEKWQDFQTQRSRYRDEMIKVFGGEPVAYSPLLHGRKGNQWVHVGPLDGPISGAHVWNIAREAQQTTDQGGHGPGG